MKLIGFKEMNIEELIHEFSSCLSEWKQANQSFEFETARMLQERMEQISSELFARKRDKAVTGGHN